ncbi:MAG: hypothetical protein ABEJ08_03980 [Halobacteriaceae archaeon]
MADLRAPEEPADRPAARPQARSRGQLILVGGLAVAVGIVVLVLLLNTAIYTQNLTTRDADTGDGPPLALRESVTDGVADLLGSENRRVHTDRTRLGAHAHGAIGNVSNLLGRQYALATASARITNVSLHNGTYLRQTDSGRALTSDGGMINWTLAKNADGVRKFNVNTTDVLADLTLADADLQSDAFRVVVEGASDTWIMYVYRNSTTRAMAVKNGSASNPNWGVCSSLIVSDPSINLTAGTVDGSDCPALAFAKGVSKPYDIKYANGDNVTGTYNLTVNTTKTVGFNPPGSAEQPRRWPVIYDADLTVVYEAPDLRYATRVHVEPEGGP